MSFCNRRILPRISSELLHSATSNANRAVMTVCENEQKGPQDEDPLITHRCLGLGTVADRHLVGFYLNRNGPLRHHRDSNLQESILQLCCDLRFIGPGR